MGGRGAPDGHDRVTDELFDGATVAPDDLPRRLEVAAQKFAHGLGVTGLGEGREPDEVGEEDADDPSLGRGPRPSLALARVG